MDSYSMTHPNKYEICLAKESHDDNAELILIIGIPSVSITICCIAFFICCFKCARLKLAALKLRAGAEQGGDDRQSIRGMLEKRRRGFFKRRDTFSKFDIEKYPPYATANNYTDMQDLANINNKDVWEIDSKNLLVQEECLLGNGAFANVFKGVLKGKAPLLVVNNSLKLVIESERDGHYEVAVKKMPPHADDQNRLDFFHEIEFMKRLGHHPHVISMLGCVSNTYDPMIVVEYCERGDLLKFLRLHKEHIILNKTEQCPIDADICLRIKDLVSIAWQIADGMAYLSSKNFIHRDLAARNVLLTKSLTAKISDFGLCRCMDSSLYTAKGGRLPIKWMSIEALKFYEFSIKSDVWSYGVLLFEIFSLGDIPYPTVQQMELLDHLLKGNRLPQPQKCPNEIFEMMKTCWEEKPEKRPDFNDIRTELTGLLNLDDESYGYLNLESDDGHRKVTTFTLQSLSITEEEEECPENEDNNDGENICKKLDQVMSEKFGEEQASEIKKVFCEFFPSQNSLRNSISLTTFVDDATLTDQ
ncbi:unnamed protein product [Caenorhabditis bovis]|uniref:Protein kinase domain-containing protein n=1 Tax=Caenorhabditis bovis TaxID=2654633 RepID=A0A8S1EIY2_9PELO|nr:unnamed protein product [Caenorhabditis bovis]